MIPDAFSGYGYGDGSGDGDGYGDGYGYGDGSGDGYGYGDGDGYGSGSGNGDGSGSGSRSGDGYGYGYGDGYGSGSGNGDGYGSGYGDGSGDGDGYGYGYGYGSGSGKTLVAAAQLPTQYATDPRTIALWNSALDGTPANGGKGPVAYPGLVQEVSGPLELCTTRALHATLKPEKWKGERTWIVALDGEVVGDEEKMAALKREIIAEVIF